MFAALQAPNHASGSANNRTDVRQSAVRYPPRAAEPVCLAWVRRSKGFRA